MITILYIVQMILAVVLIGLVVLQSKNLGAGAVFGGSDSFKTTRRGIEKTMFNLTILVSVLFFVLALVTVAIA